VENKAVLQRNIGVLMCNILARKSEKDPLQYCKTGAELEHDSRLGYLVRNRNTQEHKRADMPIIKKYAMKLKANFLKAFSVSSL
jgi:hypothetical protein